jgi:hypothetical protein
MTGGIAGGLLKLVALGSQDIYLMNNPQITYFDIYKEKKNKIIKKSKPKSKPKTEILYDDFSELIIQI